ncbi:C40 family peptidase [Frondihabitans australicus]|uniref:Cell wall-associated NlpC family hydrolase n=1 Tax=Frondihabitans australicus TaxID=386892 RepID=A0A495IH42_9MICO|nr:C40 family peptidase [Frondihabitans australicus]RKR75307.1 cell wall-associated NlpC family hydrolase [Frondihabitans australicus]
MTTGIIPSSNAPRGITRRTMRTDPIRTGPIDTVKTAAAPATRRAAREAVVAEQRAASAKSKRRGVKKTAVSVAVMGIIAGLFGTMALPAFAHSQTTAAGSQSAAQIASERANGAQNVQVANNAAATDVSRDNYTASVPVTKTVSTTLTAAQATQAAAQRAAFSASTAYSGETAADYLANPSHPAFSLAAVYQTALKYQGTPYVFGGATPAGFDCSGFVMYVYAQFGISLQHSVPLEDAAGVTISQADAEPGDLVVFDNEAHDGFYAGNGMILDAPKPGGVVSVRPIWNQAHHFVRLGISK